jgi:integrin-linked kinase-associated serine/threonine phosphatase 2C
MGNMFEGNKKRIKGKAKEEDVYKPKGIYAASKDGEKKEEHTKGQDSYSTIGFTVDNSYIRFIGVYDGHGDRGKIASEFVATSISNHLLSQKNVIKKWNTREIVNTKFTELFKRIQKQTAKNRDIYENSGTCAVSALITDKYIYVINLGDSRAVIGSKSYDKKFAIQMSNDHKPNDILERERIIKSNGEVTNTKDGNTFGPYRVYKVNDNGPGLAVARSLGDLAGHDCGVSEIPQVSVKPLEPKDEFLLIGSDGVFDVMNSVECVGYVFERLEVVGKEKIAEELVDECRKRWILLSKYKEEAHERMRQELLGEKATPIVINPLQITNNLHIDDITCVICFFKSN